RDDPWNDDGPVPPVIPQKVMNIVSVLLILALVFGSVGAAIVVADQGEDIAILIGLAVCLTLLFGWFVMRSRAARRR
ncbi:MAG TPA: hypothetical protein VD767_03255, partial [Thermomicrobiales bacterium]|nr:hypothetical protein [Thermomicrobiales bacterium]